MQFLTDRPFSPARLPRCSVSRQSSTARTSVRRICAARRPEGHMAEKGGLWVREELGAAPKSALPPTHHGLHINSMQGPPVKETVPVRVVESSEAQWFPRVH